MDNKSQKWAMFGLNIKNKFLDKTLGRVINEKAIRDRNTLCNSISSTRHCKCKRWPKKLFRSKIMFLSSMLEKSRSYLSLDNTAINLSAVLRKSIENLKKNSQPLTTRKSIRSLLWWTRKLRNYRVVQSIRNLQIMWFLLNIVSDAKVITIANLRSRRAQLYRQW